LIDREYIKASIDAVREAIGRDVTFYAPKTEACPLCVASGYYDSVGDTTYYYTCPVCDGAYYLATFTETDVLARVHWTSDEGITATPGGKYFAGDAQIHIEDKWLAVAEASQVDGGKVIVDGHKMTITKIIPTGEAGINRYRIILSNTGERPT
jgi:hypothetical protein